MRTAFCKVTTWQGKLVIKNPTISTKKFFYYLYLIISSSKE